MDGKYRAVCRVAQDTVHGRATAVTEFGTADEVVGTITVPLPLEFCVSYRRRVYSPSSALLLDPERARNRTLLRTGRMDVNQQVAVKPILGTGSMHSTG